MIAWTRHEKAETAVMQLARLIATEKIDVSTDSVAGLHNSGFRPGLPRAEENSTPQTSTNCPSSRERERSDYDQHQ